MKNLREYLGEEPWWASFILACFVWPLIIILAVCGEEMEDM